MSHELAEVGRDRRRTLILVWLLLIFCSVSWSAQSRRPETSQPDGKRFRIQWVAEISTTQALGRKKGFVEGLLGWITGGKEANLVRPVNVLAVARERFLILDQGAQRLLLTDLARKKIEVLKFKTRSLFPSLVGVGRGSDDWVYFSDSYLNQVFVMRLAKRDLRVLNRNRNLSRPTGVAYCPTTRRLWVAETGRHRLVVLDEAGEMVAAIGARGTDPGRFNFPTFLWVDDEGRVYVVDSMNFRVQIFTQEGELESVFGEPGDATGYFARPKGIATDEFGHVYVVDALFNTVQIFDRKGRFLYNFGTRGREPGQFWLPSGLFIADNKIYVADSYNSRVQVFELQVKDFHDD